MGKYDYTPRSIARMSESAVKKTYTELRKIANKRAARMAKAGFKSIYSGVYYPTIAQLGDIGSIRSALAAVARALRDPRSSMAAARKYNKRMIDTFHEHGYDFVNEKNLKDFIDYMEWARARSGSNDRVFKSDRIAEVFEQAEEESVSATDLQKNFEDYLENYAKTGRIFGSRQRQKSKEYVDYDGSRFTRRRRRK